MSADDPLALCRGANDLLSLNPSSTAHRRGAAFVARQAIEAAVRAALGGAERREMRWKSRFLVLDVIDPLAEARHGLQLWSAWSELCHYHPYDPLPGEEMIRHRLDETRTWITSLATYGHLVSSHSPTESPESPESPESTKENPQ